MSLQDLQQKKVETQNNFEGIPIFAASGIHEKAFEILKNKNIKNDDPILILGAGAGAFDKRLISNGYTNITSVEFVPGVHMVSGVKLLNIDLNQDFAYMGNFKAVIALEIIEHLENQFHFIRQIKKMFLDNDSFLILSTPNIESSFARLKYFVFGRLQYFAEGELYGTGHINPIFEHILKFNLKESGLRILKTETNHSIWKDLFTYKNLIIRAVYFVFFIFSRLAINKNERSINIYLISKC